MITHIAHEHPNHIAEHDTPESVAAAQAGKWIAMLFFSAGVTDLATTQAAFDRHPEWTAA